MKRACNPVIDVLEKRVLFGGQAPMGPMCVCVSDSYNQDQNGDSSSDEDSDDAGDDSATTDSILSPDAASDQAADPQTSTPSNPQLATPVNGANLDRSGDAIAAIAGGNPGADMYSDSGVNYSDGEINLSTTDLSDSSDGSYLSVTRSWTNLHDNSTGSEYGQQNLKFANGGVSDNQLGYGWASKDQPQVASNYKGNLVIQNSAISNVAFDIDNNAINNASTGTYQPLVESPDTLTKTGTGFVDSDGSGDQQVFADDDSDPGVSDFEDNPTELANAYGAVTVNQDGGEGAEGALQYRDFTVGGIPIRDEIAVAANDTDFDVSAHDGQPATEIDDEFISDYGGESPTTTIRSKVFYTYYGNSSDSNGSTVVYDPDHGDDGQLRSAQVTDGSGNIISNEFYVYYTSAEVGTPDGFIHTVSSNSSTPVIGYPGGLKYRFSSQSYEKLLASFSGDTTLDTATDAELSPYADASLQYNSDYQVSQISLQGQGCSSCGGGIGTYRYTYAENGYDSGYSIGDSTPDTNAWAHETTETLPDGNTNIVYTNYFGEPVLSVYEDTANNPTPDQWRTAFRYDDQGRVIMEAQPSAVSNSFSLPGPTDTSTDLLGYNASTGDYANISNTQGDVQLSLYYGDTSPVLGGSSTVTEGNDTLAGGAAGYLEETWMQQGDGGGTAASTTPVPQESLAYYTHSYSDTATGATLVSHPEATDRIYQNSDGSGEETTSYAYTYYPGTDGIATIIQTNPIVSNSQNGPGVATTQATAFDQYGYPTWTQDANGYITYTEYDPTKGGIVRQIQDADPGSVAAPVFTCPFTRTATQPLNTLVTLQTLDAQGRPTELIGPKGNITFYYYDDTDHIEKIYPGWNTSTYTTTGPVQLYQDDLNYTYSNEGSTYVGLYGQELTYCPSSIPVDGDGLPTGADTVSNIQTLTRSLTNAAGQVMETDQYFALSGTTYSTSNVYLGSSSNDSASGNYTANLYQYNERGELRREEDPSGTITDTEYDGLGRVTSVYEGTDDSTNDGYVWVPGANNSTTNNMVLVTAYVYDNGGVGDGNLTEVAKYPGGSAAIRAARIYYDFRDRPIADMDGAVQASGSLGNAAPDTTSNDTFVTFYTVDNLGEVTETDTYNANGAASVNFSSGSPIGPASGSPMILTAAQSDSYDNMGRVFASSIISVDPTTHSEGSSLTTYNYYDGNGQLIATISPTGSATKYAYNGEGWNTFTYVTDGSLVNNSSNASIGTSAAYAAAASVALDVVVTQTKNVYDNDGNLIETIESDRLGTDATSAVGALGNSSAGTYSRTSYTASYFDAADRDLEDVNVGTGGSTSAWTRPSTAPTGSATVLVTTTTFNDAGWKDETTDLNGIVTKDNYDMLGRTIETIANYNSSSGLANSVNQTTDYSYDGDNNVLTMTANMPSGTASQVTHYVYGITTGQGSEIDANNVLYQVQYPDPTSGTNTSTGTYNQSEGYKYNALGEQIAYTDRNGNAHSYAYDQIGRILSDAVSAGTNVESTVAKLGYTYNNAGQLATLTSYNSGSGVVNQVQETYNGFGQLLTDAQSNAGNVSGGTATVSYAYDSSHASRLASMTYPDGRTITYNYASGVSSVLNMLSNVSSGGTALQSYSDYLGLDVPGITADGNGVSLSYINTSTTGDAGDEYVGLDRFGRIVSQNWSTSSQGVDQFNYGYDQDGNVLSRVDVTNTSSGTTNSNLAGQSQTYTYDGLNRLTNMSSGVYNTSTGTIPSRTGSEGWALDAVGNWINSSSGSTVTSRTNNAQNQIVTVGSATLGYDANGNTLTDQAGQMYVYDAWNRLVKVSGANGALVAQYSYDAEGRRITETHGTTTTDLYYSNRWQVVQENVGGLVTAEHVWSPFYVDAMIQTKTNPLVTANQSNGSVDTGFGVTNTSNHTTITTLTTPSAAVSALDGTNIVVGVIVGSTPELLFYNSSGSPLSTLTLSSISATSITGLVVQPNGKIDLAIQNASGGMIVAQLKSDLSADTSFNASGGVDTFSTLPVANGLTIARNGDLLVAGTSGTSLVTVELNSSNGSLDTAYNTSGVSSVAVGEGAVSLSYLSMAVAPDGELIFAGVAGLYTGESISNEAVLMAVEPNGSADSTFGTVNVSSVNLAPGYSCVAISPAGQIYFGYAQAAGGGASVSLKAYEFNSDGSVDTAFGTAGVASASSSGNGSGIILQIQLNGEIVIGAGGSGSSGHFILARFNPNGTLDTSFGTSGIKIGAAEGGGLSMMTAADGEAVIIGKAPSGSTGIILQEFNTLATSQTYYVEYDADYNVTSLSNSSGGVIERYAYDPYGNVTVEKADGTTLGNGSAAGSLYGWVYLHQGLRLDVLTGLDDDRSRIYSSASGRFLTEDPDGYIDGSNQYQIEFSCVLNFVDPYGTAGQPTTQSTLTQAQRNQLQQMLTQYETSSQAVYQDNKGINTIGIGHNLDSDDGTCKNTTGKSPQDLINGATLSPQQVQQLFDADLNKAIAQSQKTFPNFDTLPADVQTTLIDLNFNFGGSGLRKKFPQFCKDIDNTDFSQAAIDLSHHTSDPNSPPTPYMNSNKQRAIDNVNRLQNSGNPPTTQPTPPTTRPSPPTSGPNH